AAIQEHRITHLFLPPSGIRLLLRHPDVKKYDYSSLRFFIYGAAPAPIDLVKEALEVFGPVMATGFAQTETGHDVTFMRPRDLADALRSGNEQRLKSCGRASSFVRVGIMTDEGGLLGPGDVGEIVVQSNQVMKGYYGNAAETANVSRFGWHHT